MGKVFVIDVATCNGCHACQVVCKDEHVGNDGCHACQVVCKDEHVGNDWTPIARPQPDTGQFWLDLTERVRGTVPKVKVAYRPHLCMHCRTAPCIDACTVEGALYTRDDGLVIIDPVKCTGCKNCVDACPYSAIYFNDDLNIAQKCTGCAHLLDDGWTEPRCADACPTLALRLMDEDAAETQELIAAAEVWKPARKDELQPRVYYLNLPRKFIAGTLYDPVEEEVIIGASLTLTETAAQELGSPRPPASADDLGGDLLGQEARAAVAREASSNAGVAHEPGTTRRVMTDSYGDFWFEDLPDGVYDLRVSYGDLAKDILGLDVSERDINLGDIPLA
jgi:tetrathionate reductase subunit B